VPYTYEGDVIFVTFIITAKQTQLQRGGQSERITHVLEATLEKIGKRACNKSAQESHATPRRYAPVNFRPAMEVGQTSQYKRVYRY